ncbi:LOW QUALITY PROTEIN: uncharacterized protein LJ264_010251 [Porphyrio hochstetteri]
MCPSAASLGVPSQLVKRVLSPELCDCLRAAVGHAQRQSPAACTWTGWSSSRSSVDGWSSFWEERSTHSGAAAEPQPDSARPTLAGQAAAAGPGCVPTALRESCTALGYRLCPREREVAQASAQRLSPAPGSRVQLLGAHRVSPDCRSRCFHRRYRLPCRHVLAVPACRGPVEAGMVCRRWQRRHRQPPLGDQTPGRSGGSAGSRGERVRSLGLELANLLLPSERKELGRAALPAPLAAWARSPAPGEAAGGSRCPSSAPDNGGAEETCDGSGEARPGPAPPRAGSAGAASESGRYRRVAPPGRERAPRAA